MDLLDSRQTAAKLVELMGKHCRIAFAVAWAGHTNKVFEKLQSMRDKIQYGVIGTKFCQTHWKVLEWSLEREAKIGFVFKENTNAVFHPKVYLLWSDKEWDALIGSANLTVGGMDGNVELMLHLSGNDRDTGGNKIKEKILKIIEEYWDESEYVSYSNFNKYKKLWIQTNNNGNTRHHSHQTSELLSWSWQQYHKNVASSDRDELKARLALLAVSSEIFKSGKALHELDLANRKGLAGTYHRKANPEGIFESINTGFFGYTYPYGYFAQLVNQNSRDLSEAIDCIPLEGTVSRDDFRKYIEFFQKSLAGKNHGLGVGGRLLTIKRPDVFVPFNGRTRSWIKDILNLKPQIQPSDYDRYWDEVIVPISESGWYNEKEPKGKSSCEIWRNRVALLDALAGDS